MSPSKPLSNAVAASNRSNRSPRPSSPIKTSYLVAYNLASAAAWGYVLSLVVKHMSGGDGYTGIKEFIGVEGGVQTLLKRASTAFDQFGNTVKWVQTAAILEAVHSATRLVRSPLGTTVAQIASRILIVWYICVFFPDVPRTAFYVSMVTAWSFAEIIRYLHYATSLLNVKLPGLEWIRYTAFYVLYPVGAGSEAALIVFSKSYAEDKFGPMGGLASITLAMFWPPALAFMMIHMHSQRAKHVGGGRGSHSKRSIQDSTSSSTPTKTVAPKDITSNVAKDNVIEGTASATPARSTRSRTKVSN